MANNIAATSKTTIGVGDTSIVFSADVTKFKSVKLIVSVKDETADKIRSFELFVSYTLTPIAAQYSAYSAIGDALVESSFDYTLSVVYDGIEAINVQIANNGENSVDVYVGEIERIE
jgi:hypothetical protein